MSDLINTFTVILLVGMLLTASTILVFIWLVLWHLIKTEFPTSNKRGQDG